jgi:hypothetical protein
MLNIIPKLSLENMSKDYVEMELMPHAPTMEANMDGSEKNYSPLNPVSLIERSFIQTTSDQRFHAYARESLWLEQKRDDLKANEKPATETEKLNHDMDEIMMNLVENNIKYGTHCFAVGHGETSAVLLLTPVRTLGEKRPDPSGNSMEESQSFSHTYALASREGFFSIKFIKDTNENGGALDDQYSVGERNLAYAVQRSMWESKSKTRQEIEDTAKSAYGLSKQEVVDKEYLGQTSRDGLSKDSNGRYNFHIGTYQISTGSNWLLQKIDGQAAADLVREAIIVSRENGEKRIVEPQDDTRKQLQVDEAILNILKPEPSSD